ncbi:MAG: nucleoside hydrolase, partial [Anaerolineae bacterium]|nr:nucleoside hydrolase [Anaerolineae bacterium]
VAGTYQPPVYKGMGKPLLRQLFTSEFVHGSDGMGEMQLADPELQVADAHAVDKIIELIHQYPHELDIITLGPLTNIAWACAKAPEIATLVKSVVVMGGSGLGPGNITPLAEFNVFVDAEAAQIVIDSGMPLTFVGWELSIGETFINQSDIDQLLSSGSTIAAFCVRCNDSLKQFIATFLGKTGFDLPDPVAMMVALYPDVVTRQIEVFTYVEYRSADGYGQLVLDQHNVLKRPPNARICLEVDAARFKEKLFELIQ